ncbi:hypothetical protein LUZ60_007452 [Juncus effusus]|nr:hypothetical protein LUZ60_007452 [Juncus effusus]
MLTNPNHQDYIQTWSWPEPQMNQYHHHNQVSHHSHGLYYTYEKEHMFEKPLTPSDVGKLNRLVIPKQYAERFFPLDPDSGEKGLLLNFEDESGKAWRFRYSYWTSSQSYVLTKGWSRYVKEKQLEAGDVVFFERVNGLVGTADRLYIGWKKRGSIENTAQQNRLVSEPASPVSSSYNTHGSAMPMQQDCNGVFVQGAQRTGGSTKRLRLFGVNLDCVMPEPESDSDHHMAGSVFGSYTQLSSMPTHWRSP